MLFLNRLVGRGAEQRGATPTHSHSFHSGLHFLRREDMKQQIIVDGRVRAPACLVLCVSLVALACVTLRQPTAYAEQPPPPCHPNPTAAQDRLTVGTRGDVSSLPLPLKNRLIRL